MVTVSKEIIEHVLRTLEELKVAQEEIRSKLNERGLPVYVIPAAGDYHMGCTHEQHAARLGPRKRMEEDETHLRQEYLERTQNGAPNRNNHCCNVQHKMETRCNKYEHPPVRERPRDSPADYERSPSNSVVDQMSASSPIQRIIGEDRVCSPSTSVRSQSPSTSTIGPRRYVRPRSAELDIFWRERQQRTNPESS